MKVSVCMGKSCKSKFAEYIIKRLEGDKQKFNFKSLIIEEIPCMGCCSKGPNVIIDGKIENNAESAKISKTIFDKLEK